ncbi:MAG: acyl-CoA carboxylase subunit beta [Cyclobacteriaceae bacterium]
MDESFKEFEVQNTALLDELQKKLAAVKSGGGEEKIKKEHLKGKLTARERISFLLDPQGDYLEIGALAAEGLYEEEGGCPSAGVVILLGKVKGRLCVIVANDATVKSGAWFPMTAKKNLRAQEIAMENLLPIIYLVDSAGVFLPLQDEVFPDKEHFGRQFRNSAKMSSMGIVQVAAIMGSCVAGGAYLPILSDEALIVDKTGSIFLAGSYLVKSAIGEVVDNEILGGATTHCEISGVTDNKYENDETCLAAIKEIIDTLGDFPKAGFNRKLSKIPSKPTAEILGYLPTDRVRPYDMRAILERLVDDSEFREYKKDYGKTLICGTARIDGWVVGIVANQRTTVKTRSGELQMGGVIYSDSSEKAARFMMICNQRKIPLVFFHDVSGFMVGSKAEHGGIIKDGAKMVSVMANSVVPKFTVIIGNSYGAGNYAMCGKAFDPRLICSWPTGQMAVMSGAAAANTLWQIKVSGLKKSGKRISAKEEEALLGDIKEKYRKTLSPYYAASHLWLDAVISPLETRKWISLGIEAANHAPIKEKFNPGLIQT